jgi:hypothetical protein
MACLEAVGGAPLCSGLGPTAWQGRELAPSFDGGLLEDQIVTR